MSTLARTRSSTLVPAPTGPAPDVPVARPSTARQAARLAVALSAAALVGGCAAAPEGGGRDIVATGQHLAEKGVCSRLGVEPAPGVVAVGSPQAGLVNRSLQCGDGSTAAVVLSSTRTRADRDALCAALRSDPAVLCGTGENLWVVKVVSGGPTRVATVLGSDARPASAS